MSLALFGNYWDVDVGGIAGTLVAKNDALAKLLSAEVGISRQMYDLQKSLEIVKDPEDERKKYVAELDKLTAAAVPIIKADVTKLLAMGFTIEDAEAFAKSKAHAVILQQKKLIDLEYPLMNDPGVLLSATAGVDLRTKAPKTKKKMPKATA